MRAILQRVKEASVAVDGVRVGAIDTGLLILLGVAYADTQETAEWMARKIVGLRIFNDDDGRFNRSLEDVQGSLLAVSQFTLFADARKGTRPSFIGAARPELAEPMYEYFCDVVAGMGITVARGVFGAAMDVHLINDGPVTMQLEHI